MAGGNKLRSSQTGARRCRTPTKVPKIVSCSLRETQESGVGVCIHEPLGTCSRLMLFLHHLPERPGNLTQLAVFVRGGGRLVAFSLSVLTPGAA